MNKELIKTRFHGAKASYQQAATIQYQMANKLIHQVVRYWQPAYSQALEIGVGTGCLTGLIKTHLPIQHLHGNDIIETPHSSLIPLIESGWLTYLPADAETMPVESNSYDIIISNATVQWFESPLPTLNKWFTWLKPGGLLAFTTFGPKHFALLKQVTGKGLAYYPAQTIIKALKAQATCLWHQEKNQSLYFPSFVELLKHIKATGTNALGTAIRTKSELYQMAVNYQKQFPDLSTYPLHYHPYWFIFKKQGA